MLLIKRPNTLSESDQNLLNQWLANRKLNSLEAPITRYILEIATARLRNQYGSRLKQVSAVWHGQVSIAFKALFPVASNAKDRQEQTDKIAQLADFLVQSESIVLEPRIDANPYDEIDQLIKNGQLASSAYNELVSFAESLVLANLKESEHTTPQIGVNNEKITIQNCADNLEAAYQGIKTLELSHNAENATNVLQLPVDEFVTTVRKWDKPYDSQTLNIINFKYCLSALQKLNLGEIELNLFISKLAIAVKPLDDIKSIEQTILAQINLTLARGLVSLETFKDFLNPYEQDNCSPETQTFKRMLFSCGIDHEVMALVNTQISLRHNHAFLRPVYTEESLELTTLITKNKTNPNAGIIISTAVNATTCALATKILVSRYRESANETIAKTNQQIAESARMIRCNQAMNTTAFQSGVDKIHALQAYLNRKISGENNLNNTISLAGLYTEGLISKSEYEQYLAFAKKEALKQANTIGTADSKTGTIGAFRYQLETGFKEAENIQTQTTALITWDTMHGVIDDNNKYNLYLHKTAKPFAELVDQIFKLAEHFSECDSVDPDETLKVTRAISELLFALNPKTSFDQIAKIFDALKQLYESLDNLHKIVDKKYGNAAQADRSYEFSQKQQLINETVFKSFFTHLTPSQVKLAIRSTHDVPARAIIADLHRLWLIDANTANLNDLANLSGYHAIPKIRTALEIKAQKVFVKQLENIHDFKDLLTAYQSIPAELYFTKPLLSDCINNRMVELGKAQLNQMALRHAINSSNPNANTLPLITLAQELDSQAQQILLQMNLQNETSAFTKAAQDLCKEIFLSKLMRADNFYKIESPANKLHNFLQANKNLSPIEAIIASPVLSEAWNLYANDLQIWTGETKAITDHKILQMHNKDINGYLLYQKLCILGFKGEPSFNLHCQIIVNPQSDLENFIKQLSDKTPLTASVKQEALEKWLKTKTALSAKIVLDLNHAAEFEQNSHFKNFLLDLSVAISSIKSNLTDEIMSTVLNKLTHTLKQTHDAAFVHELFLMFSCKKNIPFFNNFLQANVFIQQDMLNLLQIRQGQLQFNQPQAFAPIPIPRYIEQSFDPNKPAAQNDTKDFVVKIIAAFASFDGTNLLTAINNQARNLAINELKQIYSQHLAEDLEQWDTQRHTMVDVAVLEKKLLSPAKQSLYESLTAQIIAAKKIIIGNLTQSLSLNQQFQLSNKAIVVFEKLIHVLAYQQLFNHFHRQNDPSFAHEKEEVKRQFLAAYAQLKEEFKDSDYALVSEIFDNFRNIVSTETQGTVADFAQKLHSAYQAVKYKDPQDGIFSLISQKQRSATTAIASASATTEVINVNNVKNFQQLRQSYQQHLSHYTTRYTASNDDLFRFSAKEASVMHFKQFFADLSAKGLQHVHFLLTDNASDEDKENLVVHQAYCCDSLDELTRLELQDSPLVKQAIEYRSLQLLWDSEADFECNTINKFYFVQPTAIDGFYMHKIECYTEQLEQTLSYVTMFDAIDKKLTQIKLKVINWNNRYQQQALDAFFSKAVNCIKQIVSTDLETGDADQPHIQFNLTVEKIKYLRQLTAVDPANFPISCSDKEIIGWLTCVENNDKINDALLANNHTNAIIDVNDTSVRNWAVDSINCRFDVFANKLGNSTSHIDENSKYLTDTELAAYLITQNPLSSIAQIIDLKNEVASRKTTEKQLVKTPTPLGEMDEVDLAILAQTSTEPTLQLHQQLRIFNIYYDPKHVTYSNDRLSYDFKDGLFANAITTKLNSASSRSISELKVIYHAMINYFNNHPDSDQWVNQITTTLLAKNNHFRPEFLEFKLVIGAMMEMEQDPDLNEFATQLWPRIQSVDNRNELNKAILTTLTGILDTTTKKQVAYKIFALLKPEQTSISFDRKILSNPEYRFSWAQKAFSSIKTFFRELFELRLTNFWHDAVKILKSFAAYKKVEEETQEITSDEMILINAEANASNDGSRNIRCSIGGKTNTLIALKSAKPLNQWQLKQRFKTQYNEHATTYRLKCNK